LILFNLIEVTNLKVALSADYSHFSALSAAFKWPLREAGVGARFDQMPYRLKHLAGSRTEQFYPIAPRPNVVAEAPVDDGLVPRWRLSRR